MNPHREIIINQLVSARETIDRFLAYGDELDNIQIASEVMTAAIMNGNKILCCGNGGSMSDAIHFAAELTGKYRDDRAPMPAIAFSDPAALTCISNDFGYEYVFARQVKALGHRGDILLALSTSGQSMNIVRAIDAANSRGMDVIAISRRNANWPDFKIKPRYIKIDTTQTDRCQEMTIKILHILVHLIEINLGLCKVS